MVMPENQPQYRRIQAPIYHRPASWFARGLRGGTVSPTVTGVRSYSDDRLKPGRMLEVDVFPPGGGSFRALVEVAWCDEMPRDFPARYDVGMRLLQVESGGLSQLQGVLGPA